MSQNQVLRQQFLYQNQVLRQQPPLKLLFLQLILVPSQVINQLKAHMIERFLEMPLWLSVPLVLLYVDEKQHETVNH